MIRSAQHLVSNVLKQAKAFRPAPRYRYSSLWEFRAKLSATRTTIIHSKTTRTTWPSRRTIQTGSACASDSSLYPVLLTVTRPITHLSVGSVHVTTLQVSTVAINSSRGLTFGFRHRIWFLRGYSELALFPI